MPAAARQRGYVPNETVRSGAAEHSENCKDPRYQPEPACVRFCAQQSDNQKEVSLESRTFATLAEEQHDEMTGQE